MNATEHPHRFARKLIRSINRVITFLEVLVLGGLLIFGVYAIWDNLQIDNENTASQYEMYKPTAKDTRTYDDFRKVNPDVCGWLTINDTGIDYPLVRGEDNDEYMNQTPDLQFALSGSLFLDYRNHNDFSDWNTIIYGHHMEGPSMFGALDKYASKKFFDRHGSGLLFYNGQWHELDVFAFLEVDAYDEGLYSIVQGGEEYQNYLDYIKNHALQYRDIGVTTSDHILVMSTCMTDKTNGRYIVTAKIGAVTSGPSSQTKGRILSRDGLSPRMLNLMFAGIGGLIVLALVLLYLWYQRRKRRRKMQRQEKAMKKGFKQQSETVNAEKQQAEETAEDRTNDEASAGQQKKGKKRKRKKKGSVKDDLLNLLIRIAVIIAVVWIIFSFVFGIFVNSGVGMEPSIQDRDIVIFYRLDNEYTANEAVVYEADGEERLGRIVARGGDTVEITDEGLKVNGYLQQDYKNTGDTLAVKDGTQYPVTLASDEYFILGDNREGSTDSRMFGAVKLEHIKGSVLTVLRRRDI